MLVNDLKIKIEFGPYQASHASGEKLHLLSNSKLHHSNPCHLFSPEHSAGNSRALPESGHPTLSKDVAVHSC